jgi:hypothetical protein
MKNEVSTNEGIDKIKIVLNPIFINYNLSYEGKHICPLNHLTIHTFGDMIALGIHAEYLNLYLDMHQNIALAIYDLVKKNIILFPDNILTLPFIYSNLNWFVLYLQELEFNFDFKRTNIEIDDEACTHEDSRLIKKYDTTHYTSDYRDGKTKSIGEIYDREVKDKKDLHKTKKAIEENPFKIRLEYRLCRNNCPYLHMDNIQGDYKEVFKRYLPYLAIIYNNYFSGNITTNGKSNKNFNRIKKEAAKGRLRYTGKKLKKSEPLPTEAELVKDRYGRRQMQEMILGQFLRKNNTGDNDD